MVHIAIVLCGWCDGTGASSILLRQGKHLAKVKDIWAMPQGGLEPARVAKALLENTDGVCIACQHSEPGRFQSEMCPMRRQVGIIQGIMARMGLNQRRLQMRWIGPGDDLALAAVVDDVARDLASLGHHRLRERLAV